MKLQSAEDFANELIDAVNWQYEKRVEARDKAVLEAAADAYRATLSGCRTPDYQDDFVRAILHAIDPPMSERERLGRALYKAHPCGVEWEELTPRSKEHWMEKADAVLDELAKIKEEQA